MLVNYYCQVYVTLSWNYWKQFTEGPTSTRLLQVQLPVIDNADCKKAFINKKSVIDDKVLCAGDMKGVKDSCQVLIFYIKPDLRFI